MPCNSDSYLTFFRSGTCAIENLKYMESFNENMFGFIFFQGWDCLLFDHLLGKLVRILSCHSEVCALALWWHLPCIYLVIRAFIKIIDEWYNKMLFSKESCQSISQPERESPLAAQDSWLFSQGERFQPLKITLHLRGKGRQLYLLAIANQPYHCLLSFSSSSCQRRFSSEWTLNRVRFFIPLSAANIFPLFQALIIAVFTVFMVRSAALPEFLSLRTIYIH